MSKTKAKLTAKQRAILDTVTVSPFTPEQSKRLLKDNINSKDGSTHWSNDVKDWPSDRWDPISTAPMNGESINIRYSGTSRFGSEPWDKNLRVVYDAHFAEDLTGECQPAFSGWFTSDRNQINCKKENTEWQPLWAKDNPTRAESELRADLINKIKDLTPEQVADMICSVQPMLKQK